MEDAIKAYLANGGKVTKVKTGANLGITKREWDRLVRGENEPVEIPNLIETHIAAQAKKPLRLRAGFGAVR